MSESKSYWESFYSTHRLAQNQSGFANFVAPFLIKKGTLVDLGCGNGRDSIFFSETDLNIIGIDQCVKEIDFLNTQFEDVKNLSFVQADMTSEENEIQADYFYSRFTIHSIDQDGENSLLKWVSRNISDKGMFFIEVRSVKDEFFGQGEKIAHNTYFTDHWRRFIDNKELVENLNLNGFEILYNLESKGLAPYKDEDPVVMRIVARKK